jgi:hypothetical protein
MGYEETRKKWVSRFLFGLTGLLAVTLCGCSGPRSRVYGKVVYQGKPLAGGTIVFLAPNNQTYPARIQDDGSYEMAAMPRGHILVAVQADVVRPRPRPDPGRRPAAAAKAKDSFAKGKAEFDDAAKGGSAPPPSAPTAAIARSVNLPVHYGDPNQSGLAFELTAAEQEYNVELKD